MPFTLNNFYGWLVTVGICLRADMAQDMPPYGSSSLDPSSYSNIEHFKPEHLSFALFVNFDSLSIDGRVTHTLQSVDVSASSTTLYMDVRDGLNITGNPLFWLDPKADVHTCPLEPTRVFYDITTPNPNIGSALAVALPCAMPAGTIFHLQFDYVTNPHNNKALSWLTPEQTAGKMLPYLYSLCQMNYCRDFAPMMDTPSQKITFDATVVAPIEFVVKMSGNITNVQPYNVTHTITTVNATIKIPTYLIAILVGDVEERKLSDRVSVVSEPSFVGRAAQEFENLPAILEVVEEYLTPYSWGQYSIVFMPPSFPWGGMEHPLMTFASHTLVTGDKSKVSTAIHELTHSWFGNDVGCRDWNDYWINEGLNTFMERKTLALLFGEERALIEYYTYNNSMYDDMLDLGLNNSYTALYPDVQGDDPENTFSLVPYEKGSQFVYYMERLIGEGPMQQMLREYIGFFSQEAISYPWDTWIFQPGMPPVSLNFSTELQSSATQLAEAFLALEANASLEDHARYFDFIPWQQLAFVQTLANSEAVTAELLSLVDSDYSISLSTDPDVKTEWFILGIKTGYNLVLEPCYKWMGEQGRNAIVKPTFQALVDSGMCNLAEMWFADYESFYNIYVVNGVRKILEDCLSSDSDVEGGESGGGDGSGSNSSFLWFVVILLVAAMGFVTMPYCKQLTCAIFLSRKQTNKPSDNITFGPLAQTEQSGDMPRIV